MDMQEKAITMLEAQQAKVKPHSPQWMVGEQLKDLLRAEPHLAELVEQDLEGKEMSLAECEKKIKAHADRHKTGNFACVTPLEAEEIIREFYGLPAAGADRPEPVPDNVFHLEDFF